MNNMITVTIEGHNTERIKTLLNTVPDIFKFVPIKFSNENNKCYASVSTTTIDTSTIYSSKIELKSMFIPEDVEYKLPMNKIVKQILSGKYDLIRMNDICIKADGRKKSISTNMYVNNNSFENDKVLSIPTNSKILFDMVMNSQSDYSNNYVEFNLDDESIKEFIQLRSLLQTSDKKNTTFKIKTHKNDKTKLVISASDNIDNNFTYIFETNQIADDINVSFDNSLFDAISKASKIKEDKLLLVSNKMAIISGINNELEWLIGVQGK